MSTSRRAAGCWAVGIATTLLAGCDGDPAERPGGAGGAGGAAGSAGAGGAGGVDRCRPAGPYPAPGAFEPNRGPGGPRSAFDASALYTNCAYLDGGPKDADHHNLLTMYDGFLLMPWAPEFGNVGGLTLWEIDEPCAPTLAGSGFSERMRETHSIGFSSLGGRWAVVDGMHSLLTPGAGGIQFWDLTDTLAPEPASELTFEEFMYPDAYARVTLSTFWQVPYVFVGGADNGIYVVDATDPLNPVLLTRYVPDPIMRVGQVQVIGDLLIATVAEGARTLLLDVSDPAHPQPMPNGDFDVVTSTGDPRDAYFSNFEGGYIYYANKDSGGGLLVMDIRDPSRPRYAGERLSEGNGGYVFLHEGFAFEGESSFAAIYDVRDATNITEVARLDLTGDLDTMTPVGNVVVLSVDDDADEGRASAIAPWREAPDATPPRVTWSWPLEGAAGLPLTARVGVTFSELVDVKSVWEGSIRLYEAGTDPDTTRVPGVASAQEVIVNFSPSCPLKPNTEYVLEIPAGGVRDATGNAITEPFTLRFRTAGG
ncbi:MAG: Ig-like domain-containing protein [Polyangiaceae bacterium]|nr:Ig-like domain-containing protein [Polyangiaceae bacterium]